MFKFNNMAFIYQPHFNSSCFRVAANMQKGVRVNYIVVTCSPTYNGIYKWLTADVTELHPYYNNKRLCYNIPIDKCKKIQELETIKDVDIINEIKKQQEQWLLGQVENKAAYKTAKPEWML